MPPTCLSGIVCLPPSGVNNRACKLPVADWPLQPIRTSVRSTTVSLASRSLTVTVLKNFVGLTNTVPFRLSPGGGRPRVATLSPSSTVPESTVAHH